MGKDHGKVVYAEVMKCPIRPIEIITILFFENGAIRRYCGGVIIDAQTLKTKIPKIVQSIQSGSFMNRIIRHITEHIWLYYVSQILLQGTSYTPRTLSEIVVEDAIRKNWFNILQKNWG